MLPDISAAFPTVAKGLSGLVNCTPADLVGNGIRIGESTRSRLSSTHDLSVGVQPDRSQFVFSAFENQEITGMGWLRYVFLGDLGQQLDLVDQRAEIDSLRQQLHSRPVASGPAENRMDILQRENDELKLYLAVVLRLLISKGVATADEMRDLVSILDREDGTQDTKYSGGMLPRA